MRTSTVKLVFSFCANAKFKDIACLFNHHYHVVHVLLNLLSITHDPRLRKHCISSDPLTSPRGEINWCQTWLGNTQGVRFSQLAWCPRYKGPRYNGVAVYM